MGDYGSFLFAFTIVHRDGEGYEVEFTTLDGETIAIVTLTKNQVRPCKPREIAHVRGLTANP